MRYQVFYNVITDPEWVIVDTARVSIYGNYWLAANNFDTEAEARTVADRWNADGYAPTRPAPVEGGEER